MKARLAVLMVCLAGCASTEKSASSLDVSKRMILPVGAMREEVSGNMMFLAPVPIHEPMPEFPEDYPAGLVGEVDICAELTLSADGMVTSVSQISSPEGCEQVDARSSLLLYPQVAKALREWTYFGAAVCHYTTSEDECTGADARHVALPVKLAYRFSFRTVDGRRVVRKEEP